MMDVVKKEPLSGEQIERFAQEHGLCLELVADAEAFEDYLQGMVQCGDMLPSEALELYCGRHQVPLDQLAEFAEDQLDFEVYAAAVERIDSVYEGDDISEIIDWFKDRSR
jgi:hypothetical protein